MPMSEKEVDALAAEVGEVDLSDPQVQTWVQIQVADQERRLKELRAAFALAKLMRDDDRMKTLAADVGQTKKLLAVLKGWILVAHPDK
jgi:hypothetical protein